jgi:ABC-type dipeptide/oligopeptide/nickel transport system permease component
MKRFPQLTAFLAWLLVTAGTFGSGIAATAGVAELTNSGFGSCGPFGNAVDVVVCMFVASFPVSIAVGIWAAWWTNKWLRHESNKA